MWVRHGTGVIMHLDHRAPSAVEDAHQGVLLEVVGAWRFGAETRFLAACRWEIQEPKIPQSLQLFEELSKIYEPS